MVNWLLEYEQLVKGKHASHLKSEENNLSFWQDRLFLSFLTYCQPVSFIAVIPGIYISIKYGHPVIAAVDAVSLLLLIVITFANKLPLRLRKLSVIVLFYILAIFLINTLGYIGPGVFYLFGMTILIALIFPRWFAWLSILVNGIILAGFDLIIGLKLFNSALIKDYTAGTWIAFSSNLIFLSIVLVALIHHIFNSLQLTIKTKDHLQERYKSIFDFSPLPMWLFDAVTLQFLYVNEATVRHYGYTEEEFLKMTIRDIRPPGSVKGIEDLVKENKASKKFYQGKAEHIKKNGEYIYVNIESNLLDIDGRPTRLVLATDITEKLKSDLEIFTANLRIKDSESNLRAIFESAIDGFVLLDAVFCIKAFNSKAREYIKFNKNQKEFEIGKNIFDFFEESRHSYFKEIIQRVYKGEVVEYDRRYRRVNGDIYWIHYTITPVYENNLIWGACINGRDITAGKIYIKTIEDQNKTLREISWMQSHLVRAPLARIMGLSMLLKICKVEKEREEMLEYLTISSHELDETIKKITNSSNDVIEKYPRLINQKN